MFQIYDLGRGGKHRDTLAARAWRNETSRIAKYIRARYPNMPLHAVLDHAELELASAYRQANLILVQRTMGVPQ